MHTNSIHTEYYQENDGSNYNQIYSPSIYVTSYKKQSKVSSTPNLQKIQDNIKQYHQRIRKNKDTIHQLECQRKFFQKLSEKQMQKISQINTQELKAEYQTKILKLKNQTAQIHQHIACLHESIQQNQSSFKQTCLNLTTNKQFLLATLIQLEKGNEEYQQILMEEGKTLQSLSDQVKENEKIIQEKQAAYRKYIGLQIQIEKIEKIVGNNQR